LIIRKNIGGDSKEIGGKTNKSRSVKTGKFLRIVLKEKETELVWIPLGINRKMWRKCVKHRPIKMGMIRIKRIFHQRVISKKALKLVLIRTYVHFL